MATETPNLKLQKPAGTDLVDVSVLNGNMDILDTQVAGKLDKDGGTMTGDLKVGSSTMRTNGYVISTWLQTTSASKLSSVPDQIAVLQGGWIYYVTKAQLRDSLGVVSTPAVIITLTSAGWSGAGPCTQMISATGVTVDNDILVTLASTASVSAVSESSIRGVHCKSQGDGVLTFEAESRPIVDIPIAVKVL